MSGTTNKQPIKVGILEISAQNRAILEFFFSGAGKSSFKEVSLDKASAYIIDYDSLGAKESWKSTFKETKKPGIVISIKEVDLPSTTWLKKPLTVKALEEAGESIREIMLNKVLPEPVVVAVENVETPEEVPVSAVIEDVEKPEEVKEKIEHVVDDLVENIIEPLEDVMPLEAVQNDSPQVEELTTVDIIDIPSAQIDEITSGEQILEELENSIEPKVEKKEEITHEETLEFDDSFITLIEETAEAPEEIQLAVESTEEVVALVSENIEPKLAIADTKKSASSSSFAATTNFIDIDLGLSDTEESHDDSANQKSSTTPIEMPEISKEDEDSEVDFLLESLISGGKSSEKVNKHVNDDEIADTDEDPFDFNLKTLDLETTDAEKTEPEQAPELTLEEPEAVEEVKPSIDLESEILEDPKVDPSNDLVTSLDSLETTTTIDDEVNSILQGKSKVAEPKKTAEEELQSLLEEIRLEADETSPTLGAKGSSQFSNKHISTNAEERWELTCGNNNSVDLHKITMFNPSNHLLASLINTVRVAKESGKVSRLKCKGMIVVIDPETDHIYCDQLISTDYFANICYEPMPQEKIKVHQLDKSEIRLYRKKMKEDSERTHYTEAFVWTSSLLTSRGRLPKNTNLKTQIGLTSWPNLTRVESIPHMMQIAALFDKNTWSLLEITNKSDIQTNYVIAFYNAVHALDMIQTNGETTNSPPLDLKSGDGKHRNFLSRLLKKLTA